MKWKTDAPNLKTAKHGEFYWFKGMFENDPYEPVTFKSPTVVQLHSNGHQLFAKQLGLVWWIDVNAAAGEWAGPIEHPTG